MNHILKLNKEFYPLIESGIKDVEIRKTNKSHLFKSDDIISYSNIESTQIFGAVRVMSSTVMRKESVLKYKGMDEFTRTFINENYQDESELLFIAIEPIDSKRVALLKVVEILAMDDEAQDAILHLITEVLDDEQITSLTRTLEDIF